MGGGLRRIAAVRIELATDKEVERLERRAIAAALNPATPGGKAKAMQNGTNGTAPVAAHAAGKRNLLNRQQERKLEDWISTQWERVESERPTREVFAAQATEALGFQVSCGNVAGSVKVLDRKWPNPKHSTNRNAVRASRTRALVAQIASMCRQRQMIASADFAALCGELGIEAPPLAATEPVPAAGVALTAATNGRMVERR